MDKKVFPDYYDEKDKAVYYDLYNKGESLQVSVFLRTMSSLLTLLYMLQLNK